MSAEAIARLRKYVDGTALLDAHAKLEAAHTEALDALEKLCAAHTEALDALEKLCAAQKHVLEVRCAGGDLLRRNSAVLAKAGRR